MKKVESVFNGSLEWGKAISLNTFPQILFGLLSLMLPKIFTVQEGEGGASALPHHHIDALSKLLIRCYLTLPNKSKGEKNEKKPHFNFHLLAFCDH